MKNKEATEPRDLTELIFSWSLEDIFNKELYKDQVKKIPETFQSVENYFGYYVYPLLEEIREELCSSLEIMSEAPYAEVISFEESKHEALVYSVSLDTWKDRFNGCSKEPYKTLPGDIFIVSNAKPELTSDFERVGWKWTFASVISSTEAGENRGNNISSPAQFRVKAFKDIEVKDGMRNSLFVVFLMNITTNKRVWNALHKFRNLKIIKEILNPDFEVERSCNICSGESNPFLAENFRSSLSSKLNKSQTDAVLACLCKLHCNHKPSIELIWGPPGTGKTETVSMLLVTLLRLNCRILTCAPTIVAIKELASRVQNLVQESFERDNQKSSSICSCGDILLFGNEDRLKVSSGTKDIYLGYRVERLMECVAPLTGWRHRFTSMTNFLKNCASQYQVYLENEKIKRESVSGTEGGKEECKSFLEFARKRFKCAAEPLTSCLVIMCTHIPKRFLLESNFQLMVSLIGSLDSFRNLLFYENMDSEELEKILSSDSCVHASPILSVRSKCVLLLEELQGSLAELKLPSSTDPVTLKKFCFQNASLFFCTASSSYKLRSIEMEPLHLLIVDEAAQLKECESAIPLQLPGISHAVLIGDECQLPAMVNSTISKDAGFGRSLFERLSLLGHHRKLLNVQYRMHPSISSFPNLKFYRNMISDAPNVKSKSYRRNYLPGPMFGPYSFINVFGGKEEKEDVGYSWRNLVEAAVAAKLVGNLYKAWNGSEKLSIGVISAYAAQVVAIQDKLGKRYENINNFSVKVNSIDGFQGGEEDIIIISTVRSNAGRELRFLSDQRTNVSLTRARHCLWILGNERTLAANSNSVWESLLCDAKYRRCFFNADEDEDLAKAILEAKKELDQLDDLLNPESILFKSSRWKVLFSDNFKKSFGKLTSPRIKMSVINLLLKLSSGWRPKERNVDTVCKSSSQILKQFKVEKLYVVCTVDILKESEYIQVLKIWDILPLADVPELVKRLDNIFSRYNKGFIDRCKRKSLEGKLEVPTSWPPSSEIVRFKNLGTNGSESELDGTTLDGRSYVENSKVSESLLLMKFYSLSAGVVNHLLSDPDGSELDLPFEVTDEELEIILFCRSTFILGRSGTGKTTVLTMKMFQKEQQHMMASEGFLKVNDNSCPTTVNEGRELAVEVERSILRQVFVTVSSKLCHAIKQHVSNLKSFVCGGTFTAENRSIDMDDIDDVQFKDIPDTFIDVPPNAYPLVMTFHKFLMMLDGTLGNSYFERFHDARELSHGISSKSVALQTFIRRKEVSYDRFNSCYWPHFNSKLTKKLDSTRVFTEIISHIKGGLQATDGKLDKVNYIQLSDGRVSTLSTHERERIYYLFQDYEKMKIEKGEFDLADLVNDLHRRFRDGRYMGDEINFIYIDEVQDLTMRQIALFKYICKNVDEGFVFSGDTAQTIARGIDFRFQDIRNLFYKEFVLQSRSDSNDGRKEKGKMSDIFRLSQNFRTHAGVLNLAQSVIELLYKFFPLHIDVLSPETSLIYGESPVLLEPGHDAIGTIFGKSGNIGRKHVGFGAEQVILVRDESARNEIFNYIGKQALVLTIVECKGLEFQDVLLYNFFSSSPLKNEWRVIYQYMKEQNLLDTASIRFPNFTPDKHNVLCSELKQLYVAITRTRQRLWISENIEELSKPMFDYWKKLCVVQVRQLDDSLTEAMQLESSPDEWRSRGIKLLSEHNYEMATMCFERAGDLRRANLARAAGLEAEADRMGDSNPKTVDILRQAAETFDSFGFYERAAGCFYRLNEYEKAGTIYLEKCGESRLNQAGECFSKAGRHKRAAEIFARGNYFSDCLSVCRVAKLFDMGLQFIQCWRENAKTDVLRVKKNKEKEKVEQEFLKTCALHYHELKDNKSMMKFVRAFSSSDSIRRFLKNLHCLDELLTLEEEMGNFLEASSIAKQRGDILHSADLLGKAGQFREASNMILWYVCANSLWSNGSRGWPLKHFMPKEDLLSKAKLFAKNESDLFYEYVCTEASILLNKEGSLSEMKQNLFASRKHKSLRGEILSARKILDAIIHLNTSKYKWDQDMISDVSKLEYGISCNQVSLQTLVYFWDLWKEKILSIFEYLEHLETQDTNEYMRYGEFCLNYLAVRRQFTNLNQNYVLLNSDSEWVREIDDRLLHKKDNLVSIDARQFTSVARNYWISEMLSVGMEVLQTLESLYKLSINNSLPVFSQSICLIHMYEVAKFLSECKFLKYCSHSKTESLDDYLKMSTDQFFSNAFPLDGRDSLTEEMALLRENECSINLYGEVISGNISSKAKLTYGQIGRVVMIMLGSGKLPDEIYEKVAEKCDDTLPWKTFIGNLSMKNSRVVPLGTFTDSIYDTYSINWRAENDYISPGCFLYFLERFLISISSCRGHFFSSKSSFVEWLIFQEWAFKPSSSSRTAKLEDLLRARGVVAQIVGQFLFFEAETKDWLRKLNIDCSGSYQKVVLRLVVILCLLCLDSVDYLNLLFRVLSRSDISSRLPLEFVGALRRVQNRNRFLVIPEAFKKIGNPLVLVRLKNNNAQMACHDAIFIDMTCNPSKEDLLRLLFLKNVKAQNDQINSVKKDAVELSSNSNEKGKSPIISASKSADAMDKGVKTQYETKQSDSEESLNHFWEVFGSLNSFTNNVGKNISSLMSNATMIKVDVEKNIELMNAAFSKLSSMASNDGENEILLKEMKIMLDELKELAVALDVRKDKHDSTKIAEIVRSLELKRPILDPFLNQLLSQNGEGFVNEVVSETGNASHEKEEDNSSDSKNKMAQTAGNKDGNTKPKGELALEPVEAGSGFGNDDYNPLSMDEIGAEQTKEEELAKALKASMDTTLEEQAAPEAGYLFGDFPAFSTEDPILGSPSRTAVAMPEDIVEVLAPATGFEKAVKTLAPADETVAHVVYPAVSPIVSDLVGPSETIAGFLLQKVPVSNLLSIARDLVSFTRGSDALLSKGGSYASEAILELEVLEGLAPEGNPQCIVPMYVEEELSTPVAENVRASPKPVATIPLSVTDAFRFEELTAPMAENAQASPEPITTIPLSSTGVSSFEGLVDRPLEPFGAPSLFFMPAFAQHVISTLLLFLQASTNVADMVHLINDAFRCLDNFNVDLRSVYDHIYNLLCLRRELLTTEATLEMMTYGENASSELQAVVEQMDQLQDLSCQILDDFGNTSKRVDYLRFNVSKVKLLLSSLTKELTDLETKLTILGDTHANIEQKLEQLSIMKDMIAEEATQVQMMKAKVSRVRKAIDKLEGEVSRDLF